MFKGIIKKLFEKWEVVYSTHEVEKYARTKAKLIENNIKTKTEFYSSGGGAGAGSGFDTIYHVLVQSHNVYKAHEIIYRR